jgi:hypothetical protein
MLRKCNKKKPAREKFHGRAERSRQQTAIAAAALWRSGEAAA